MITQAVLFDGRLLGYADFLIRQPDGTYAVADAKLARSAKVRAVLQIAAYHDLAATAGIARLRHGLPPARAMDPRPRTTCRTSCRVVHERRAHLDALIAARRAADAPVAWRDPSVYACGRCPVCQAEVEASRDVLLVAGLRMTQRAKLAEVGITTIDELADATFARRGEPRPPATQTRPEGIAATTLAGLQAPGPAPGRPDGRRAGSSLTRTR